MTGKILKCTCKHEQQDKLHGTGNRLHNATAKPKVYRCIVCCKEREGGD